MDCEWYLNQQIFLIGYARSLSSFGQLYGKSINKNSFIHLLKDTTGIVFFYGPDIGMLEKFFRIPIRKKYRCVNLLRIAHLSKYPSYKLYELEKHFQLTRTIKKYKSNIHRIYRDWKYHRSDVLQYNREDVLNLIHIKKILFYKHKVNIEDFLLK